jgi:FKBP-type peptidyl-prolyl cis-trans isomerase
MFPKALWGMLLCGLLAPAAQGWWDSGSEPISVAIASELVRTPSGLRWLELRGGGGRQSRAGDSIEVHYTIWLTNGKKVDSSVDRGQPFAFKLGAGMVIKGFDEGLTGMRGGSKRKLLVPAKLAYGNQEVGGGLIPANSGLVIEVELLKVK